MRSTEREIVERYARELHEFVGRTVVCREDAEEVVQDALLRALRSLPEDFADRVLMRLHADERPAPLRETGTRQVAEAPTVPPPRRLWPWAAAASIALAIAVTATLWPRHRATVYQDTFASAEEACMALGDGADNNTILL